MNSTTIEPAHREHDDRARAPRERERCAHRNRGFRYLFMRGEGIGIRLFWA
jgi:hypothetical protein